MNTSIIVQARMGSTRFPGKVLAHINGLTALECLVNQIKFCKSVDNVIVATTTLNEDNLIAELCNKLEVELFRGDPVDVLDRYYQCAKTYSVDNIVRLTADNPLIDPSLVDQVVNFYQKNSYDYVSNCEIRTYPYGSEVEIFSCKALEKSWKEAKREDEREHVTIFLKSNKEIFQTFCIHNQKNISHYRWTVDTKNDLELVKEIYKRIDHFPILLSDILNVLEKEPDLLKINQN